MKKHLLTAALVLLSACHGSCNGITAAERAAPAGAACYDDFNDTALCLQGPNLYACQIDGAVTHDATCHSIGTVTYTAPARP